MVISSKIKVSILALTLMVVFISLPVVNEFFKYYICLSKLGSEDYVAAARVYNEIKERRPDSYKVTDLSHRIKELAKHHCKNAEYFSGLGKQELARQEIEKAYLLSPLDKSIIMEYTRLNLSNIAAKNLLLQKETTFQREYFSQIETNPMWSFVLGLSNGELALFDYKGNKLRSLGKMVENFHSSGDGEKYAFITTKIKGNVRTPEIWIGHTKGGEERLKLIGFRDHILRSFSGFDIEPNNIKLVCFSPDNKYLFFKMINPSSSNTLWKYNYSTEESETYEKVKEVTFKPGLDNIFCYTKSSDTGEGDVLYKYSEKYGRRKINFDAKQNQIIMPQWSPDQSYIAFDVYNELIDKYFLNIISPNGRIKYNLGPCEKPSQFKWSPAGDKLYFLKDGKIKIWLSSNKNFSLIDLDIPVTSFKISPGGNKLIFLTQDGLWLSDSHGYNSCELKLRGYFDSIEWVDYGGKIALRQSNNLLIYNFLLKKAGAE